MNMFDTDFGKTIVHVSLWQFIVLSIKDMTITK